MKMYEKLFLFSLPLTIAICIHMLFYSLNLEASKTTGDTKPIDFVPSGYILFEEIFGDLNHDRIEDCILIIKGTDKKMIVEDEYRGVLDRNRRGILVLIKKNSQYELVVHNLDCFSSENEDGGVYFAPELYFEIEKGNLYINYGHGRYGYWKYTFRLEDSNLNLIGYDNSEGGSVVHRDQSINFLTKKKRERVNINENAKGGEEVFKETWENIQIDSLIRLSEIEDFDELVFYKY